MFCNQLITFKNLKMKKLETAADFEEGCYYLLDMKIRKAIARVKYLYQGTTAAGHLFFVNDKGCYKVHSSQIGSLNAEKFTPAI